MDGTRKSTGSGIEKPVSNKSNQEGIVVRKSIDKHVIQESSYTRLAKIPVFTFKGPSQAFIIDPAYGQAILFTLLDDLSRKQSSKREREQNENHCGNQCREQQVGPDLPSMTRESNEVFYRQLTRSSLQWRWYRFSLLIGWWEQLLPAANPAWSREGAYDG
jgi:hypothetical protein